jgi:hypothetical protein
MSLKIICVMLNNVFPFSDVPILCCRDENDVGPKLEKLRTRVLASGRLARSRVAGRDH